MLPSTAPAPTASPHVSTWGRAARMCRWVLIVGWVALALVAVLAGERDASLAQLEDAVAAGEVREVEVAGGLDEGDRGAASVQVRWDRGLLTRTTALVEQRPLPASRSEMPQGHGQPVVADVEARLRELQPDLQVARSSWSGPGASVLGWGLPAWAGLLHLGVLLGTLFMLVGSPPPWRATRWAWLWVLVLVPPLGIPAYLLLAGPTAPVPSPSPSRPRTTGGRGFLLGIAGGIALSILTAWSFG